jgi:hypothetical protein
MKKLYTTLVFSLLLGVILHAQTPGLIVKKATGIGQSVLDPDGDGYVSAKTNGVQLGFTVPPQDDVAQSEIPFAPIVQPDPFNDLLKGPACGFTDIVGVDAAGNNAIMSYYDEADENLLFRFRLAKYAPNSKAYSILIDTDQKFGFSGAHADPNALPGNAGFEVEVVLRTNFSVDVYKVDGTTTPVLVASYPYESHAQKAVALTGSCDQDYFYDFFVPFSVLQGIAGLNITPETPLRMAAVTGMSPSAIIGSNNASDIGGVTEGSNLDVIFTNLITTQTPTSIENINSEGILDRSVCPTINPVFVSHSSISGASEEPSGTTIYVKVYNGAVLVASGETTTVDETWSINNNQFSPSLTLVAGQTVIASAKAVDKGESLSDCSVKTVITSCTPPSSVTIVNSGTKGVCGSGWTVGNTFSIFNNGTLIVSGSTVATHGGVLQLNADGTWQYKPNGNFTNCTSGGGANVPNGFIEFSQTASGCESARVSYNNCSTTSAAPSITTNPVLTSTGSIAGTGTAAGATIKLFINGVLSGTTTTGASPFNWSVAVSNLQVGQSIRATQTITGSCESALSTAAVVARTAIQPVINFSGCAASSPVTSISGFSVEAEGTIVTLYKTNGGRTSLGTATVNSVGAWTRTGLSLVAGDVVVAAVTSGVGLLPSVDSESVTIVTRTNVANYTLAITAPTEKETSVQGTISGGTYPITLRVYVDEYEVGSATVAGAGSWTVSGLTAFDLSVGGKVEVTVEGNSACESAFSATFATVQCLSPDNKTISALETEFCSGSLGVITVQNSQEGIIYTPVLASNNAVVMGYSVLGNGEDVVLYTNALTGNVSIQVKASKIPVGSCDGMMSGTIQFTVRPLPAAPVAEASQTYCLSARINELSVSLPSGASVRWYDAAQFGNLLESSNFVVSGTTYYAETLSSTGCVSATRTAVTPTEGVIASPIASANQTFFASQSPTIASIQITPAGPGTILWHNASVNGDVLPSNTPLVNGASYYASTSQNDCTSARVSVTITIIPSLVVDNRTHIIPVGTNVTVENLTITTTGKLENEGTLTITGTLLIEAGNTTSGQLLNNGTIIPQGEVIVRREIRPTFGWVFIGMPYDVTESQIRIAGTQTQATWGDLPYNAADVKNFYIQAYDADKRDKTGTALLLDSPNWKNVVPRTMVMNQGYIIAVASTITLDFVYTPGEATTMFNEEADKAVYKYTTNNASVTHHSWNLLGQPFIASFDLQQASSEHAPFYYYNGLTYNAVMAEDTHTVPPFSAFFSQAHGVTNKMNYKANGRKLRNVALPSSFEQISLLIQDNVEATYTDKTRIRIQEGRTINYELGHDAMKMTSLNTQVPQIYTRTKATDNVTYSYAVNALPTSTTIVDLVVTTGKAGSYTVSLENIDDAPGYSSIILVVGTREFDLLEGSYTFSTSRAQTMNWKVKLVQGVVTQVAQTADNGIDVATINNKVYINGLESEATVSVYNVSGKLVQTISNVQNNQALTINNAGVSVLTITTATQQAQAKVLVE